MSVGKDLPTAPKPNSGMAEIVAPLDFVKLEAAFKTFQNFKEKLLSKNDSVDIQGKRFLKKSAWRKWALACSVSDEIDEQERVPTAGKDPKDGFYWRFVVKAFHIATGRSGLGVGIASSAEKKNWAHEEHDVYALAHTRA